jgi:hypothetical protein
MTQADSVHSTPPINTSANNLGWEDKAEGRAVRDGERD